MITPSSLSMLIFFIGIILIIALLIGLARLIAHARWNRPTWKGIIISAILGALPLYLFLCLIGVMGDDDYDDKLQ